MTQTPEETARNFRETFLSSDAFHSSLQTLETLLHHFLQQGTHNYNDTQSH